MHAAPGHSHGGQSGAQTGNGHVHAGVALHIPAGNAAVDDTRLTSCSGRWDNVDGMQPSKAQQSH